MFTGLPPYIPLTPTGSSSSTPSLSKRRDPCPQQSPVKRKRTDASEHRKRKEPSEQPSASKRAHISDEDSDSDPDSQSQPREEDKDEQEEQEDQVTESFDPDNYYAASGQSLPPSISDYVEKRFRKCIPVDKRRKMFKDNPIPDTPAAKPPQPDDDIVAFLGKDFPSKSDKRLRRIQATTIAVAGPLTTLWANLVEQDMGQGSGTLIPVDDVIDTIQRSLSLLGNSVNYISQARRELIISQLEYKKKGLGKVMRKVCQSDLENTGKELFGEKFRKTLKSKADSMVAFGKIADRVEQNTRSKNQSFRGGPSTSRYAGGAGKNLKPYQKANQNRPFSRWNQPRRYFNQNQQQKREFSKPAINHTPTPKAIHSSWWSPGKMCPELAQDHQRSLGIKYDTGLSHQIFSHSACEKFSSSIPRPSYDQRAVHDFVGGNSILTGEIGHNKPLWLPGPRLLQQCVCCPEKGWGMETYYQPPKIEQLHSLKMENVFSLRDILKKGDWLAEIDLKDAYLTVPMAKEHRKYLRFQWQGKMYEFKSLPFGLATAPITFTKLLRPVVAFLRQQGVRLVVYLDDILLMAETQELLQQHLRLTMSLLTDLGFMLNLKKCVLTPCRRLEFLGFIVDSLAFSLYIPPDKIAKIKKECRHLLNKDKVSGRTLAHIIGLLSSVAPAVLQAPLRYRGLQRLRSVVLQQSDSKNVDYDITVPLNLEARQDLTWWTEYSFREGRPLRWPHPTLTIESDASKRGWGAHLTHQQQTIGGIWNPEEAAHHINWKAAFLGLQAFAQNLSNVHIHLLMDSTVAIAYLNRLGGTRSYTLCQLAISVWDWCLRKGITVHADHLPGRLNVRADFASRNWNDNSDWMLDPAIFSRLQNRLGRFSIDLFASFQNAQLPKFFSWKPSPKALAVDALAQRWNQFELPYAFPPFALIGRCLQKIREEKVKRVLIIAPVWPA